MDSTNVTDIWKDYQRGRDYLNSINLFDKVETCFNMVNGDQWKGLKYGKERPPQLNILLPIMKSSTALVGQNVMNVEFTSMNYGEGRQHLLEVTEMLNNHAKKVWERLKMDKLNWEILQDAYISGNSAYWFYDDASVTEGKIMVETLDTTNIMLGDEQQPDIQKQPYILIVQRKHIEDVKKMAENCGIDQHDINSIIADSDTELQINGENEVRGSQKVTVIAKLWKKDGIVHIMRATKTVVIQPETAIDGIKRYPIAMYTWKPRKGLARGDGDIWDKIPNQISINKSLFRMEQAVKNSAYPIKAYNRDLMENSQVAKLNQPGAAVAVKGNAGTIANAIGYLQPANISPYAKTYWQDLIQLTRDLSGAGDNLENVNPEQASGASIQAALDAKLLNVNMQVAAYRQFVEDIAWIWYEMFAAYNPNGLDVVIETEAGDVVQKIPQVDLMALKVDIKVDALPSTATHSAIKDSQLRSLLENNIITFEEYVSALADDSTMPVEAFKKIVEGRAQMQQLQQLIQTQQAQIAQYQQILGGMTNEMQIV
ncbi:MAG: hypothetical protein IKK99_03745 [Oscillospiraceae bacterium]|nr:hypothetical protein [Oscillospiraceae bacterium]